jgi:segregation and condensation protein A
MEAEKVLNHQNSEAALLTQVPPVGEGGLLSKFLVEQSAFCGPFDVLLHLIEAGKLSVDKISIADIIAKFVAFILQAQQIDMDGASEFLLLSAYLIEKKSKTMLPHEDKLLLDEDVASLEAELVQRLAQYRAFKSAAGSLKERKLLFEKIYARYGRLYDEVMVRNNDNIVLKDVSLADLVSAFKKLWDEVVARDEVSEIQAEEVKVEDRMLQIRELLNQQSPRSFRELFPHLNRIEIMVTFLAILELIKQNAISFKQDQLFGEILVFKV